jgi:hypothetical protein
MCDFSGKLIAWMDGELTDAEVLVIQEHLDSCADCQCRLASYRWASGSFAAYCEAATTSIITAQARLRVPRWAFAAAAVAVAVAPLLFVPRQTTNSPTSARESVAAKQSAARSLAPARPAIESGSVDEVQSSTAPSAERGPRKVAVYPHRGNREYVLAGPIAMRPLASVPIGSEMSPPAEPAIEIAFTSDAIFPEGAVPKGVSFVAEVTLAADGSAEQLRLQPRLVEFQGRTIRP